MYFDEFIGQYLINYDLFTDNFTDALNKLQNGLYDIISYKETMELISKKKIQLCKTDYITDFDNIDNVYYIIDNKEYPLLSDTMLFLSLTPLKPIYLIYNGPESITIKYRRYCIKQFILDSILYKPIICDNIKYSYGEVVVSDIRTESCKLIK
jgi:hypothetical protein